jgi:hypothetical protein
MLIRVDSPSNAEWTSEILQMDIRNLAPVERWSVYMT